MNLSYKIIHSPLYQMLQAIKLGDLSPYINLVPNKFLEKYRILTKMNSLTKDKERFICTR